MTWSTYPAPTLERFEERWRFGCDWQRGTRWLGGLAKVAGQRWRTEQSLQLAKGEVGLNQYEVLRWETWHRHMTLAMPALTYLAALRIHLQVQLGAPTAALPTATSRSAKHRLRSKTQVAKGVPTSNQSI